MDFAESELDANEADSVCNDRDLVGVGVGFRRREVAKVVDIMIKNRERDGRVHGRSTQGVGVCCRPSYYAWSYMRLLIR